MRKSDNRAKQVSEKLKYSTAPEERRKERAQRMKEIQPLAKGKAMVLPIHLRNQHFETVFHHWMEDNRIRQDHFATVLGCTRSSIRNWRYGVVVPSLVYAFRIEAMTKGKVPVSSWMDTPVAKWLWDQCLNIERTPVS